MDTVVSLKMRIDKDFNFYVDDDLNMGDLTGKFPASLETESGNSYILVMVSTKTNYIHIEPLRDRHGQTIASAYERGINFYERRGIKTTTRHQSPSNACAHGGG